MPGFEDPAVLAKAQATRAANKAKRDRLKARSNKEPVIEVKPQVEAKPAAPVSVQDVVTAPALDRSNPPRDLLSGQLKGTEVFSPRGDPMDPIPGYRTYWVVDRDQGSRLKLFRDSGWEHVTTEEVLMNEGQSSDDAGGHVRKWSRETGQNSTPIYMYLMKKPLWLQAEHDKSRDAVHDAIEARIKGGAKSQKPGDAQYAPGEIRGKVSSLGINIESKLYQPR